MYARTNGVWTQLGSKLVGTGAASNAEQGVSVSISSDGNTAILGGFADDSLKGAAWVFTRAVSSVRSQGGGSPLEIGLAQNYPNPFNPSTVITYSLPRRSHVTLTVYNTLGQQVAMLVNSDIDVGSHTVQFNASTLASGVYFYRMTAGSYVDTKKLFLVRDHASQSGYKLVK